MTTLTRPEYEALRAELCAESRAFLQAFGERRGLPFDEAALARQGSSCAESVNEILAFGLDVFPDDYDGDDGERAVPMPQNVVEFPPPRSKPRTWRRPAAIAACLALLLLSPAQLVRAGTEGFDLNGDGRIDHHDIATLFSVESVAATSPGASIEEASLTPGCERRHQVVETDRGAYGVTLEMCPGGRLRILDVAPTAGENI